MAAVRAELETLASSISRRGSPRRQLRLSSDGEIDGRVEDVLVLNISSTGLLIQTETRLSVGDLIDVKLPEAEGASAVVQWSDGDHFGCKFEVPISPAAVSAAMLRSEPFKQQPAPPGLISAQSLWDHEKAPVGTTMRWFFAISLLAWFAIGLIAYLLVRAF